MKNTAQKEGLKPPILKGATDFDKWGFDVPIKLCNAEDMYYLWRAAEAQRKSDINFYSKL